MRATFRRIKKLFSFMAIAAVSIGFGHAAANTVTLPAAVWDSSIFQGFVQSPQGNFSSPEPTAPGAYSFAGSNSGGSVSGSLVANSLPSIYATATATSNGPGEAQARANMSLEYYAEVVGPSGSVTVGMHAAGSANSNDTGANSGSASIQINSSSPVIEYHAESDSGSPYPSSFNVTTTFQEQTNSPFFVGMFTATQAQVDGAGASTVTAFVDPYFFIPATDANAGLYSIVVSEGIENISAVPEPSTWAMMLLGFAGLGFAGYRASRKNAAFAA